MAEAIMSHHQSVIMAMDRKDLVNLSELLAAEEIQVIRTPQTGLLMLVAQDPFATDFCLGEILVTEAESEYQGHRGYAMVMGDEPEKALLTAAVAAILQGDNGALKNQIHQFLAPLASTLSREAEKERQLLTKTLVSFEGMVKR
jgi:alpha-D-ribose 1-methylphosphonate 5-triphosphate synthase subunit PhnG